MLPALSGTVSISGTAQVGQTLTANTSYLYGSGTISYQWKRNGIANIGTNSSTYAVQSSDVGSTISVTVTRSGNSGSVTSSSTATVSAVLGSSTMNVHFTGPTERIISVTRNITNNLSKSGGGSVTLGISANFSSYEWYIGTTKAAEGKNVNLYANNPAFIVGDNWITVVVYEGTGAIPYSGEFMVHVAN
jgi:hypothetical protein